MIKLLAAAIAFLCIAPVALAIPYKGNTVYRTTWQGNNFLVLSGTPGQTQEFFVPNTKDTFRFTGTDVCGWTSVKLPTGIQVSNFRVNGQAINPYQAAQTQAVYNCNTSQEYANFYGASAYNPNINTYYWKGSGARQSVKFEWVQQSLRRARFNNCGFYQVNLGGTTSGNIVVNGQTYNFGSLPQANYPPLCRTIGTSQIPYAPESYRN